MGRAEFLLLAVSGLIAVSGAELLLRIASPVPDPFSGWRRRPQPYTPTAQPRSARIEVELEPGLNGLAPNALFTTNAFGFRGPPLAEPKPKEELRIFLIGGSTAECLAMSDPEALGAQLELALGPLRPDRTVRVYNAGKSGDTSADHLAMLTERVLNLEPDRVVVFAGLNDLLFTTIRPDPLHFGEESELGWFDLLKMAASELQLVRRYYLFRYPQKFTTLALQSGGRITANYHYGAEVCAKMPAVEGSPATDLDAYARNLKSMVGAARANGVEIALLTQVSSWDAPDNARFGILHWMTCLKGKRYSASILAGLLESYNEVTRRVAAESGARLIDLARALPKTAEYFYDDCHFNPKGAKVAGEIVGRALARVE